MFCIQIILHAFIWKIMRINVSIPITVADFVAINLHINHIWRFSRTHILKRQILFKIDRTHIHICFCSCMTCVPKNKYLNIQIYIHALPLALHQQLQAQISIKYFVVSIVLFIQIEQNFSCKIQTNVIFYCEICIFSIS